MKMIWDGGWFALYRLRGELIATLSSSFFSEQCSFIYAEYYAWHVN